MLLYNEAGERRSLLFGMLALLAVILNYSFYPQRFGLSASWELYRDQLYLAGMLMAVYLSLASMLPKASSLRIGVVVVALTGLWRLAAQFSHAVVSDDFFEALQPLLILQWAGSAAGVSLLLASIEGTLWSWRNPSKRF